MHYKVLVISNDYEEALAPFQANNMGDCRTEFLEWYSTETEEYYDTKEEAIKETAEVLEVETLTEEQIKEYIYMDNPYAEWDWYEVGGRWENTLEKDDGTNCNQCESRELIGFTNNDFDYVCDDDGWYCMEDYVRQYGAKTLIECINKMDDDITITIVDCHL